MPLAFDVLWNALRCANRPSSRRVAVSLHKLQSNPVGYTIAVIVVRWVLRRWVYRDFVMRSQRDRF